MKNAEGASPGIAFTVGLAIVLVALVGVSLSLTIPLLSLDMERRGVAGTLNGLNTATAGLANLAVVPFVPGLAARFGVRRLLLAAIILGIAATLLFPVTGFLVWFPLRFALGASLGALFVLSEYWINAAAPPERRGIVMGIYATVLALGFAAGPALLTILGTSGWPPYLAAASLFAAALVPLALARGRAPDFDPAPHGSRTMLHFVRTAPVATLAALFFGAIETATFGLLPVYGTRIGYSEGTSAGLVSAIALGNVLFQIPVGWLSDKVDKRYVLLACGVFGCIGALFVPLLSGNVVSFRVGLFVFGGIIGGLYTVGLAHLGQRYSGHDLASANAAFVMLYSLGLIIGPPLVGTGMDLMGPDGLSAMLAVLAGSYALVVLARILTSRRS